MPAAAHLATIQLLVGPEPVIAVPTSSDASTSQSRRVTQITSTHRRNPLFGIATPVAPVPTVASLVHGLRQMVARAGLTWKVLRAAPSGTALVARATIPRTGTTRVSLLIRTIRTGFSLTPLRSGLQPEQGQYGTIRPAVIRTAEPQVRCMWTSMRSHSCRALRAFWRSGTMAALTERQTRTLQARRRTRHGLTWIRALTQSSFTPATSAGTSPMLPLHRRAVDHRITALTRSPLPEHQLDLCYGSWE